MTTEHRVEHAIRQSHCSQAIDLARDAVKYSYHQRDSAQDDLDKLAKLEKRL